VLGARAQIMNGACHNSFRSRSTRDEHAGKNLRNFVDHFIHPCHRFAVPAVRDAIEERFSGRAQVTSQVCTPARSV